MTSTKEEFYKSLPKKRMGAGVLFFNNQGEILLVQPTYKDSWEIPGGIVELDESPQNAVIREVKEELGLSITDTILKLMCIEYMAKGNEITEALMFVFSGGVLSDEILSQIKLDQSELRTFMFVKSDKLIELLGEGLGNRVIKCVQSDSCFYSEGRYE